MDVIKAIVVDDELLARRRIREMLEEDPEIAVAGECGNARDAIEMIRNESPHIVFLDIQMPGMDGFSVVGSLGKGALPLIIFVTAYDQYALKAFEVSAADYLLKPFDVDRFEKTLRKAKSQVRQIQQGNLSEGVRELLTEMKGKSRYMERVAVKNGPRVFFIQVADIDWIEAEGNYVRVHIGKDDHMLRETISNLEQKLDPTKFLRIHRSTIVNVDRIRELQTWFHGEYHVILHSGQQLLLTRSYRDNLRELLGRIVDR